MTADLIVAHALAESLLQRLRSLEHAIPGEELEALRELHQLLCELLEEEEED